MSWMSTEDKWKPERLPQSGNNKAMPLPSTARVVSETQTKTERSQNTLNVQIKKKKNHSSYQGPVRSQNEKKIIYVNTEIKEML